MPYLVTLLISAIISFGAVVQTPKQPVTIYQPTSTKTEVVYRDQPNYSPAVQAQVPAVGSDAFQFVGGTTYTLSGSGVSSSATSFTLTSFTIPQSGQKLSIADFGGSILYGTFEPGSRSRQEFVSCTTVTQNAAGTATLSGCTRGLAPISPYTASTTLQFPHAGGASFIISNSPQFYNKATFKDNDESIAGIWDFASTSPARYDMVPTNHKTGTMVATTSEFASLAYVNAVTTAGAPSASENVNGIVELATGSEMAAGTSAGGTGGRLVIPASQATSSCQVVGNYALIASSTNGKLDGNCLNTAYQYSLSGDNTHSGVNTFSNTGTTTFSGRVGISATTTMATSTATSVLQNGVPVVNKLSAFATPTTFGSGSTATTTLMTFTVPGGYLRTTNGIHAKIYINATRFFTGTFRLAANYGGVSAAYSSLTISSDLSSQAGFIDVYLQNTSATAQATVVNIQTDSTAIPGTDGTSSVFSGTGAINSAIDQTFSITASFGTSDASNGMTSVAGYAELIQN